VSALVVVKVGSSSVTTPDGTVDDALLGRLMAELAALAQHGTQAVVVTSGAIALGWSVLGGGRPRPREVSLLQAVSAVGQPRLLAAWEAAGAPVGLPVGQVLLGSLDFGHRRQYLHARATFAHLLELGVVPVVNENDATTDQEIRYGDNDRLAALVAQMVGASHLVLLTDTEGLYTADPRVREDASLIEVVAEVDAELEAAATGSRSGVGSGGMASKLAAAKMAAFSGITVTIAAANRARAVTDAVAGEAAVGTTFAPRQRTLPARKLWIAFARTTAGVLRVDAGAAAALEHGGRSLLLAGVVGIEGDFDAGEVVEIHDADGLLAKGLAAEGAERLAQRRAAAAGVEAVHRDDLVLLR